MKVYLELTDIELMEKVASTQRDKLLIRLLSRLGCRISEALALKVKDVDFEQKTVTILHLKRIIKVSCPWCKARLGIRHQYCPVCGVKVNETIKRQQERKRIRVLPIDRRSVEMLRQYLSQSKSCVGSGEPIFCFNRHRAWQIIRDCAREAKLTDLFIFFVHIGNLAFKV